MGTQVTVESAITPDLFHKTWTTREQTTVKWSTPFTHLYI